MYEKVLAQVTNCNIENCKCSFQDKHYKSHENVGFLARNLHREIYMALCNQNNLELADMYTFWMLNVFLHIQKSMDKLLKYITIMWKSL